MKKILYATDYSENSVAALHFSYALSKELDAELMALHVFKLEFTLVKKRWKFITLPHKSPKIEENV